MHRFGPVMIVVVLATACGADRPKLVDPGLERQVADTSTTVSDSSNRPTLRLAIDGWTGDPADAGPADLGRRVVADLLFEGLTQLDADGVPQPALAEAWSVSADRLTWVFTMSPEAVDSAGRPVTARVVMLSLDHVAARGPDDVVAPALAAIAGWDDRINGLSGGVAGITAPSDDQLVVRLDRPFEPLAEVLASPAFGVVVDGADSSTGAYRIDESTRVLWPVDQASTLPLVVVMDADVSQGAALLESGDVDWVVLAGGSASDDLPGDVLRLPLDVWVGLAIRLDDPGSRRALAAALDSVALATVIGLSPSTPRIAELGVGDLIPSATVDVPAGVLEPLGSSVAEQLAAVGVDPEVIVSDASSFAARVLDGDALVHPMILAGGTWSAEAMAGALVPGGVNDLLRLESADRLSLDDSLTLTRDVEKRPFFADLLVQTAVDEGVLVLLGRVEARVGVSTVAAGLRLRADGTLDLSGFG